MLLYDEELQDIYNEGWRTGYYFKPKDCPYPEFSNEFDAWIMGYEDGDKNIVRVYERENHD